MTQRRFLCLAMIAWTVFALSRVTGAGAQRTETPPPRWVADNTLWPAQYVPFVDTQSNRSLALECAPYPAESPTLLRCVAASRVLRVEHMAAPYAALLASTQPGELERELEVRKRRECGPEAPPYARVQRTWSASRQRGVERYNAGLRALRAQLCQPCSGPSCRDLVEAIVTELDVATCEFETGEEVLDLTPTGAMRWGSETPDPDCGGRVVHSLHAEGREWVYTRTRHFDEEAPRSPTAPSRCDEETQLTLRTGLPLYADASACTVLVF